MHNSIIICVLTTHSQFLRHHIPGRAALHMPLPTAAHQGCRPRASPHLQVTALWSRSMDTGPIFQGLPPLRWAIPRVSPTLCVPCSSWWLWRGARPAQPITPGQSHYCRGGRSSHSQEPSSTGRWPWSVREQTAGSRRVPCPGHMPTTASSVQMTATKEGSPQ